MKHQDAIAKMPPHPATWTLAELIAANGGSWGAGKSRVQSSVAAGDTEVVRRGSIHGRAIYRRMPGRPEVSTSSVVVAHAQRFAPNSVWALGTMSPSVAD